MVRTALIDADPLVYKYSFRHEEKTCWGDDVSHTEVNPDTACDDVDEFITEVCAEIRADRYIVALSCPSPNNFRLKILPTYKGNRDASARPELYDTLREHLKAKHPSIELPTLEADDVLGIYATMGDPDIGTPIIVSIDKDLRTIPGRLYVPTMEQHSKPAEKHIISQGEADWYHMMQTLTGDVIDNYKGCPSIGEKKAAKILGECSPDFSVEEAWPLIVETYVKKGLTRKDALVQARCARILRHEDYNMKWKRRRLWKPPKSA